MITVFADELTRASAELCDHLDQAALIAPEPESTSKEALARFDGQSTLPVDSRHRGSIPPADFRQNVISQIEATFRIGRDWLEAKERFTRRKEFTEFQAEQPITPAEGRKAMKVFEQFGNWEQERLLIINGAVSLVTLCHPKFAAIVEQFKSSANLTKEFVKNLVKEVRDAVRVERRRKQQTEPGSGWRRDPSGGGRHYQLPPMYNEEAAIKIETLANERGVRALTVVEEAIIAYTEQPTVAELKRQHQEEMQAAVTEMRDEHIRMQREIIQLKQRGVAGGSNPNRQTRLQVQAPVPIASSFSSWTEFADSMNCDASGAGLPASQARSVLLGTVKTWSHPERQKLATLLADHLSEDQNNLDQVAWVPEKLLHSALSKLSFCVSKISGPDNMIDEPEIEHINGCQFISVQHLGVRKREQWMFEGYGGRMLTVFGRDEFKIEMQEDAA